MLKPTFEEFIYTTRFADYMKKHNTTALTDEELAKYAYAITGHVKPQANAFDSHGVRLALIQEVMDDADDILSAYFDWQERNNYERWWPNGESFFEDNYMNCPIPAYQAVEDALRGDYRLSDDYVRYDGYANLKSSTWGEVLDEAYNEDSFIDYLFENAKEMEDIYADDEIIIETAKWLIKEGYCKEE